MRGLRSEAEAEVLLRRDAPRVQGRGDACVRVVKSLDDGADERGEGLVRARGM